MSKRTKRDLTKEIEQEWENKIRSRIHKNHKNIMSYRELQFADKQNREE